MPRLIPLLPALFLTACVLPAPPAAPDAAKEPAAAAEPVPDAASAPAADEAAAPPLPYPEAGIQQQLEELQAQVADLRAQTEQLAERVSQLENRPAPRPRTQTPRANPAPARPAAPAAADDSLTRAQAAYRAGRHAEVVRLLASADHGGSGSETDRRKMQLLLNSQEHLGKCQSVIQTGRRYAALFGGKSGAADALYSVGKCQWHIQQRDIARDTWRKLMRSYPDSPAARKAAAELAK